MFEAVNIFECFIFASDMYFFKNHAKCHGQQDNVILLRHGHSWKFKCLSEYEPSSDSVAMHIGIHI